MGWRTKPSMLFNLFCLMLMVDCTIKAEDRPDKRVITTPTWQSDQPQTYRNPMSTTDGQSPLLSQLSAPESVPENIGKMEDTTNVSILNMNTTPIALNKSSDSQGLMNSTISTEQMLNNILVLKKIACNKTASKLTPGSDACYYLVKPKAKNWKFQCTNEENLENCNPNILVEDTGARQSLMENKSTCKEINGTNDHINKCPNSLSTDNCSTPVDYLRIVMVDARTRQPADPDECDMWFVKSLLAESITYGFIGILFVNNFIWVWCWTKRKRQEKLTIKPKSYKQEDFEIIYAWQNSHENSPLRPTPKVKRPRRIREVPLYENISIHEIVSTV